MLCNSKVQSEVPSPLPSERKEAQVVSHLNNRKVDTTFRCCMQSCHHMLLPAYLGTARVIRCTRPFW